MLVATQRPFIHRVLERVPACAGVELVADRLQLHGDVDMRIRFPDVSHRWSSEELFEWIVGSCELLHQACAPTVPDGPPLVEA